MPGQKIDTFEALGATLNKLQNPGLLLVAGDQKPNPMAIGWMTAGVIWGLPVCVVLVRPSRHTYGLLKACGDFTVNVPADDMVKAVGFCGANSGRDMDKAAKCGLEFGPSADVRVPHLVGCPIHYECRTINTSDMLKERLARSVIDSCYPKGDFHTAFFGQILGVYRMP